MVAMLMVGTMTPVHQAAAQESNTEKRAAMLEQINQLMLLITQLMAQLQAMQSDVSNDANVDVEDIKKESKFEEAKFYSVVEKSSAGNNLTCTAAKSSISWRTSAWSRFRKLLRTSSNFK